MDYRKNNKDDNTAPEVMTPERIENIRKRWLNSGVAVPDELQAIHESNEEICAMPPVRPEALRPKPKRDAAAPNVSVEP